MTALGLLVILFVIVPGFIADTLFRTTRGMAKGGEFERILRSLVWSVFGLGFYQLYLPEAPPYLSLIGKDADLVLAHLSILPLALHCMFACAAALVASGVAEDRVVRKAFTRFFFPVARRTTALGCTMART